MARLPLTTKTRRRNMALKNLMTSIVIMFYYMWFFLTLAYRRRCLKIERRIINEELRNEKLFQLIRSSDTICISELRMDRRTFYVLCVMLRDVGGLKGTRNMELEEIVAQFLYILAHHLKNRTVKNTFFRSGETVSRQFYLCLLTVLKLHHLMLKTLVPIPEKAMDREAAIKEKAMNENPQQTLREKVVTELRKLGFTGTEQIKAATIFVKVPDQMSMLLTLDQSLRREIILNMINEEETRKRIEGR